MAEQKKPFHETVAEKLIEQLKAGTAPWQRPWEPGAGGLPMNPTTGKRYKGINAIYLMSQNREDPRWLTYKQAEALGAQVQKGERSTPVQYWKFSEEQQKRDEGGKPVLDAKGQPIKETVMLERPRVFFAAVFNAEQIDGLPPLQRKEHSWNGNDRAEQILVASGAQIHHSDSDRAFYRPATDSIHLPNKGQFPAADRYYATALHELGHWTGHESRLARDLAHPFGSDGYAKEELRAEISSMLLGDDLGIGHDPGQHVAYVGSWIKALENDPLEIFRAAADAEKIQSFVLALEQKNIQEQATQQSQAVQEEQILTELQELHQATIAGYSPLESWENLKATARANGLAASISRGAAGEHAPPYLITYADQAGQKTAIATELWNDGKAATSVGGRRMPGTGRTSDHEWQSAALTGAAAEIRSLASTQETNMNPPANAEQATPAAADAPAVRAKTYINVPFKEKDEANALGARWDRKEKSWYVPAGTDPTPFQKWAIEANTAAEGPREPGQAPEVSGDAKKPIQERVYLAVPYGERGAAKAGGALWDKEAASWYVGPKGDMDQLQRWLPENVPAQQGPAMTPREEFAEALKSLGCQVSGDHPIMDGQKHRIVVSGDKKGEKGGFYVGHLDGHPAGYIINNRTGVDMKWKSKGYSLDPQEKAKLQAEAAAKLAARASELEKVQEASAQRITKQLEGLVPISKQTPYLEVKGIKPQLGAYTDQGGQKTYIPAFDVNGKLWTMQYIQEDGTKRFAKDSRKEGCFHPVGGMEALAAAPAIVISEGYATASNLAAALGHGTVAAFDSGNLPAVAQALHAKFPDKPVIIAGDDDRHQIITQGTNPGRTKAEEAAHSVDGTAIFPIFAPGEGVYPADLPKISPQSYRAHEQALKRLEAAQKEPEKASLTDQEAADLRKTLLSAEQIAALGAMKVHTDFNDLAKRSKLGEEGVARQAKAALHQALEAKQLRANDRTQEKSLEEQQEPPQKQQRTARQGM